MFLRDGGDLNISFKAQPVNWPLKHRIFWRNILISFPKRTKETRKKNIQVMIGKSISKTRKVLNNKINLQNLLATYRHINKKNLFLTNLISLQQQKVNKTYTNKLNKTKFRVLFLTLKRLIEPLSFPNRKT
jgi:hypothetical protein